jgi:hypothetical protein
VTHLSGITKEIVCSYAIDSLIILHNWEDKKPLAQSNLSGVMSIRVTKLNQLKGISQGETFAEELCRLGAK